MKKLLFFFTIPLLATSCSKQCDTWHTGKDCSTEIRQKWSGNYVGTAYRNGVAYPNTILQVVASGNPDKLQTNLGTFTLKSGSGDFGFVYNEKVGDYYVESGSGVFISDHKVNFTLTIVDDNGLNQTERYTITYEGIK